MAPKSQRAQQLRPSTACITGELATKTPRELVDEVRHGGQCAFGQQRRDLRVQHLGGGFEVAGPQHHQQLARGVGFAERGPLPQLWPLFGQLALQTVLQRLAEQVVQLQRRLGGVERADEQAQAVELVHQQRRARIARDRRGTRRRQLGQHRCAQQEAAQFGVLLGYDLGGEEVEHRAVARHRGPAGAARQAQAQPRGPALRAFEQRVGLARVVPGSLGQGLHFVAVELQVGLPELGHLAQRAQPCQRQRRIVARGHRQRPARAQAL